MAPVQPATAPAHTATGADRPGRRGRRAMAAVTAAIALTVAGLGIGGGTAAAATVSEVPAALTTGAVCDDGAWSAAGGSVEGVPSDFAAGSSSATYVWHDGNGWHLRTTDSTPGPHHYFGTIAASPGARFNGVSAVRLEPGDQLWVDDHQVLHYNLTTFEHVDGVDFHVTACDADRVHENLTFALHHNSSGENPAKVQLGRDGHHPATDPFTATRVV